MNKQTNENKKQQKNITYSKYNQQTHIITKHKNKIKTKTKQPTNKTKQYTQKTTKL